MTFLHALAELLVVARQDTTVWEKQFVTGLKPEANWLTAINKNLANQSLYNNVVKEILNGFLRSIGWIVLSLVLYGFDNITKAVRRMVEGDNSNPIYRGIESKTLILLSKAE